MKTAIKLTILLIFALEVSCGEKTGRCTTTCFSKANGTNYGDVTYENYTRAECEQALANRQTSLTNCSMQWN